jgi:hypothetical protein
MKKYSSMFERLVANSIPPPEGQNEGGCWLWTGKRCRRGEYGHLNIRVNGRVKTVKAHRVMYEITNDCTLREDETVEHQCEFTLCINPDHFFPETLTHAENSRRSQQRNPR